jgi:transcriptional regulator with XRE-family HTH domain
MNITRQIGLNLRRVRLARGISQQIVAFDAGLSLPHVSNIERGKANPSAVTLGKIADALGVLPIEFFAPISPKDVPSKNLPRGRNVHHQGRRSPKARKR